MMKKNISMSLLLFCLLLTQTTLAQQKNDLRYEIMLNKTMLTASMKNESFVNGIDVSPDRYITLSTGNKMYCLGWGGIKQLGQDANGLISSYGYTSAGFLLVVKNNTLCYMDTLGKLVKLIQLPTSGMGLAAGKKVMYLFDRNRKDKQYRLYALAKGAKYKQLLVSPKPITDAVEMNDSLYIAIGSGVFSFSPTSNTLNLVAGFQKESEIKSMAVDSTNDIIYVAMRDAVYAIQNNKIVYVTGDFGGGLIKYFGDGLILFNPESKDIIRIVNISGTIAF
jgi:hypothetical protein